MKRFDIIHNDGDEMCTVVLHADLAYCCDDVETGPVELQVCVRYTDALEKDIESRYSDWLELAFETRRKESNDTMEDKDYEQRLTKVEERSKSNTHRLDEIEKERSELNRNMNRMATAVELLANEQRHQTETQKSTDNKIENIKKKVESIELAPAKDAKDLKREFWKSLIGVIVGAVVGAILALIIKGA